MLPSQLEVKVESNPIANIQKFTDSFLNPQQKFELLEIPFNYVSDKKVKEMSEKSDISQARSLMLIGNNLTDFSLSPLLQNPLPAL